MKIHSIVSIYSVFLAGWSAYVESVTTTLSSYSNNAYGHPTSGFHSASKFSDGGANYTSGYSMAPSSSGSYPASVASSLLSSGFEGRGDVGGGGGGGFGGGGGGFGGSGGGWGGGGGGGGIGPDAAVLPVIYRYQLIPNQVWTQTILYFL